MFVLHSPAMEENKTKCKQAEDEGVFLWFGDDLAVDDEAYGPTLSAAKSGSLLTRLLKVPAKKSPIGLFVKMLEPTQGEADAEE